ncbi:chemotaxis protein CheW [Vibrio azureus]|uniref:CheW-like domain-containing protein n=1 Tax=Vibrio azureus NBRC 104587 TaxID=1219077 RepID=U3A4Z9_9VIBR|nr:chemotaxis protein CheW [Vibrio azureus]AUI86658.1 chemotaxis protein CheW [Vibrio azureus]GAD75091.1 hypothetical protein VAZ01S_019_00140 [Vibrio azureus NBRC 104587]
MNNNDILSSEQALDDYFHALLDEETIMQEELDVDALHQHAPEPELQEQRQHSTLNRKSYDETYAPEVDRPNLEGVQRLLKQLESQDSVAESKVDNVPVQSKTELKSKQDVDLVSVAEEIQEWDTSEVELSTASLVQPETSTVQHEAELVEVSSLDSDDSVATTLEKQPEAQATPVESWQSTHRSEDFQVLYFEVNSITFAVPLDELGGIHQITELSHLIGRPAWYLGLQTSREQQFDVVDTAKWVMADKLVNEDYKDNYQYIVMLGESMWGLASHQLMGTEKLSADNVRWREKAGKRPWLAGMVKEKMCALIHVEALIDMLNAGLDVKAMN